MIPEGLVETLQCGQRVRSVLPGGGLVQIDRALPFLCLHRQRPDLSDSGTEKLITGESSFLIANGEKRLHKQLQGLIGSIINVLQPQFGAFLLLEVWSEEWIDNDLETPVSNQAPGFKIIAPQLPILTSTVRTLESALRSCRVQRKRAEVTVEFRSKGFFPPGLNPIWTKRAFQSIDVQYIGLMVRPLFRDRGVDGGVCDIFPTILRGLRRGMSRAIRRGVFEFTRQTVHRPPHFQALGPRSVTKSVFEVDRRLSGVCENFEYLLQVTPVNSHDAWLHFKRSGFEKEPRFNYKPLPFDSGSLKRKLYQAPLEQVEDPVLVEIFREKQDELDRMITSMGDCGTKRFLPGSLQIFGGVEPYLRKLADEILFGTPLRTRDKGRSTILVEKQIIEEINKEIQHYQKAYPSFKAGVEVCADIPPGLMISRGDVLIGQHSRIPSKRLYALLSHEIGVHLATHFNGFSQPLKLLGHGLAGYEELQEGLAVFAEYMVGGLNRQRLRVLAARVVAVDSLIQGASFVETFRTLTRNFGFPQRVGFLIAMRVYRGGGLTKDAIYLRGFKRVLDYVAGGGDLETLWIGKIALEHLSIIKELKWRAVLHNPIIIPRYLIKATADEKTLPVKQCKNIIDLVE
ncbi:MAG: DUF1704 domain-containing protein [Magnetococcales bacterium]|nr:DUF1704 domain-containing protein [Magnetococcales bacterium]